MKLSIITINYNNKEGLEKTIESVMSQTWCDFEWIIIDGASTDGSKELIESLTTNPLTSNLISYWCSEPDKGIYNAMNKGIAHSKGDFLNFMNSGDGYYERDTLLKVSKYLDENIANVFIGQSIIHTPNGKKVQVCDASCQRYDYFYFRETSIPHQATFYSKDIFLKFGLFNENLKICGDWEHAVRVIYFGKANTFYMPLEVCNFEMGGISSDLSSSGNMQRERKETFNVLFPQRIQEDFYALNEYKKELEAVNKFFVTHLIYLCVRKTATLISKITQN